MASGSRHTDPVTFRFPRCRCEVKHHFVHGNLACYLWLILQQQGLLANGQVVVASDALHCPKCDETPGHSYDFIFIASIHHWPNTFRLCSAQPEVQQRALAELIWLIAELARLGPEHLEVAVFDKIALRLAYSMYRVVHPRHIETMLSVFRSTKKIYFVGMEWFEEAILRVGDEKLDRRPRRETQLKPLVKVSQRLGHVNEVAEKLYRAACNVEATRSDRRPRDQCRRHCSEVDISMEALSLAACSLSGYVIESITGQELTSSPQGRRPAEFSETHPMWLFSPLIEMKRTHIGQVDENIRLRLDEIRRSHDALRSIGWRKRELFDVLALVLEVVSATRLMEQEFKAYMRLLKELEELLDVDASGYNPDQL